MSTNPFLNFMLLRKNSLSAFSWGVHAPYRSCPNLTVLWLAGMSIFYKSQSPVCLVLVICSNNLALPSPRQAVVLFEVEELWGVTHLTILDCKAMWPVLQVLATCWSCRRGLRKHYTTHFKTCTQGRSVKKHSWQHVCHSMDVETWTLSDKIISVQLDSMFLHVSLVNS